MFHHLRFALELTRQDFIERFGGSVLGSLWIFIWPLVQLFIYIVIFGNFMGGRLPGNSSMHTYGIYLACALIPWTCFSNTVHRASKVFLDKRHIISKVSMSLFVLPAFICMSEIIPFVFSMAVLSAITMYYGIIPSLPLLLVAAVAFYIQQIFAMAIGIFCATLSVFIKDLTEIVAIAMQLWFWFTPIVYVQSILPQWTQTMMLFNPIATILQVVRAAYHVEPGQVHYLYLLYIGVIVHVMLGLSIYLLKKIEKDVRDFIA